MKGRIIEFEGIKNKILIKTKCDNQNTEFMKENRVRCDICKIYIHRASYSCHLKSKKHLEKIQQKK